MSYGTGNYVYELVPDWAKLPAGWEWGHTSGAAADAQDNVYVFNRTAHPVIVYDRQGNFLRSWGEGIFSRPHGVFITPDQLVYGSDDMAHVIRKFDLQGRLLETMGTVGQPSDSGYVEKGDLMERLNSIKRGAGPFNRPTKLVVAPWGEKYVTDGYGNARVHRFTADGALIQSWGEPGHGPGEFFLPHGLAIDARERILVADRENSRVQIFSRDGKFLEEWTDLRRPGDIAIDKDGVLYISESPGAVCVKDLDGKVLSRFSAEEGRALRGAHSICVDSRGDLYVCEIATGSPTIKKFIRQ
ncbi:MAG: peptidyl-alpha-hydroxyglycine alpha-amidating lyase family protein [Bacteroidetes bacterium]|nr:peptidyl-alpha-hydroxyglycine alpha-amidating lyase family protein [Bacteroidota bacterium]